MTAYIVSRRAFGVGAAALLGAARAGTASAQLPLPKSPVALTVMDIAGDLALTQKIFEAYAKAKPHLVSRFVFSKAPMPELPSSIISRFETSVAGNPLFAATRITSAPTMCEMRKT